jgi:hypothetical protein
MEGQINQMNELEYEVMDHLYFVTSFKELKELSNLDEKELLLVLSGLIGNEWIKCFSGPDNEIEVTDTNFKTNYYLSKWS